MAELYRELPWQPWRSSKKFAPSTPVRKAVASRRWKNRRHPSRRGCRDRVCWRTWLWANPRIISAGPEEEINALRSALECGMRAIPIRFCDQGSERESRRRRWQASGGILVRRKNRTRLVLSLERIKR